LARLVYSSGADGRERSCSRCGTSPCSCETVAEVEPAAHEVRVRPERGGRGGKTVTTARPFFLARDEAVALLKELKRRCGVGGTLKTDRDADGRACFRLELQGDQVDRVLERLGARGFPAKRGGG
jgi:translation initiation factor 1